MSLAEEYERQLGWRSWPTILDHLPSLAGHTVLDVGCAVGDQAAELVARGAYVIGVDADDELLQVARGRQLANAEFRKADLRALPDPGVRVDGIWCSFAAAYFPNLRQILGSWKRFLRPGGWLALTEIDNLFGHRPLPSKAETFFETYARDAVRAGRYDFCMGRKLAGYVEQSGFVVSKVMIVPDREFSFHGSAEPSVVEAWRARFERMTGLENFCGPAFEEVKESFLNCLVRPDHCSDCKVYSCIALLR